MITTTNALVVKMTRAVAMVAVILIQMAMMKAIPMMTATIMLIAVIAMPIMLMIISSKATGVWKATPATMTTAASLTVIG